MAEIKFTTEYTEIVEYTKNHLHDFCLLCGSSVRIV